MIRELYRNNSLNQNIFILTKHIFKEARERCFLNCKTIDMRDMQKEIL